MRRRKRGKEVVVGGSTNAAAELIARAAQSGGHGLALVDSLDVIERVTFTDVAGRAAEWAELVREQGVEPGDRVVVLSGRDREWRFALLGVIQAGGVAVPCPASTPDRTLRAIADDAKAVLFVSAGPWPDLAVRDGARAVSSDDLERRHRGLAAEHVPHLAMPADVALVTYEDGPDGLRGSRYTHASLLGVAEEAERWLGIRAGERVWSTAADGSVESIWLLLGAWRAAAEIVAVDHAFDLEAELGLLARFRPAAVWFSGEEYAALAVATASEWVEPGSIRRAVTRGEPADGAAAFEQVFGATVLPVEVSNESGVRLAGELPFELDDDSPTAPDAAEPALLSALDEAVALAVLRSEGAEKVDARTRRADEAKRRKQAERTAAEERKRVEEEKRRDEERAREEATARKEAERAAVEERRRVQEAERKRAEEEKRREVARAREEAKSRKQAEREAEKERERAEKAERAEREAAAAAERKRAEDEKRRKPEREREEEAKSRKKKSLRAAAKVRHRIGAERARKRDRDAADSEGLDPDILSSISQYGLRASSAEPGERGDGEAAAAQSAAATREKPRDVH